MIDGQNVSTDGNGAVAPPAYESIDLVFNPDGTLASAGGNANGQFTFDNFSATLGGANPLALNFDFAGSTQFGGDYNVNQVSQDGYAKGQLIGLDVSKEGIVSSRFSNGQTRAMGQVALAKFANQQGLTRLGETSWGESFASGSAVLGTAGSSNFGTMQSGALEASNVDISEQLTKLIIAQRNFQANAESIRTENTVMQSVLDIR
jgi:flagellar hook protein FlgE